MIEFKNICVLNENEGGDIESEVFGMDKLEMFWCSVKDGGVVSFEDGVNELVDYREDEEELIVELCEKLKEEVKEEKGFWWSWSVEYDVELSWISSSICKDGEEWKEILGEIGRRVEGD